MRRIVICLLFLGILASTALAHGSAYRGPASEVPPNMRRPEDPPPPGGPVLPTWNPSGAWKIWWSLNKEEILFARGATAPTDPDRNFGVWRGTGSLATALETPDSATVRKRIIPALSRLVADGDIGAGNRARVLVALGALGASHGPLSDPTISTLLDLVRAPKEDEIVRMAAAFALGLSRDGRASTIEALGGSLNDEAVPEPVRASIALALGLIRPEDGQGALRAKLLMTAACDAADNEIRDALRTKLAKGPRSAHALGADALALAMAGRAEDAPLFKEILGDDKAKTDTRAACAVGLGMLGATSFATALEPSLNQNRNATLLIESAIAAGLLGHRDAAPPMLSSLRNPDWCPQQKCWLMRALGKLGDERAVDPLLAVTGDPKWTGDQRATAAIALADLFDRSDRLVLTELTRDLNHAMKLKVLGRLFSVL